MAGCNADKRRQPRKHWMGFDNVQGMDDAKQKLVKEGGTTPWRGWEGGWVLSST